MLLKFSISSFFNGLKYAPSFLISHDTAISEVLHFRTPNSFLIRRIRIQVVQITFKKRKKIHYLIN